MWQGIAKWCVGCSGMLCNILEHQRPGVHLIISHPNIPDLQSLLLLALLPGSETPQVC